MNLTAYLALIPAPNNIQPKYMAWVEANMQPYMDIQAVLNSFQEAFDIQNAVGAQLDIIGQILGQPRTVNFNPEGGVSPILNDDNYRLVLLGRILKNQWKGTIPEIYDFWKRYFPKYAILINDTQDMSMNVIIFGMPISIEGELIFGLGPEVGVIRGLGRGYWGGFLQGFLPELVRAGYFVPKPSGVAVNYSFVNKAVFGLGPESEFIKGLGTGSWISGS